MNKPDVYKEQLTTVCFYGESVGEALYHMYDMLNDMESLDLMDMDWYSGGLNINLHYMERECKYCSMVDLNTVDFKKYLDDQL